MVLADALSRSLMSVEEVGELIDSGIISELVDSLARSNRRMDWVKAAILEDKVGRLILQYITESWLHCKRVNRRVQNL